MESLDINEKQIELDESCESYHRCTADFTQASGIH
jgi:hypothetical protein